MNDPLSRLERIRDRLRAFAQHPAPKTAESYRAQFEVLFAELDSIIADLRAKQPCDQCGVRHDQHPAGDGVTTCPGDFGLILPVTPEEDAAWTERATQLGQDTLH